MLFDLRGRGRRRTVQFIYLGLAILMGGGLVLFGIGGATSGGLLDAFKGGSTKSTSDIFKQRADAAERAVRVHPNDAAAWENLARLRFQQASGEDFDQTQQVYTDAGKAVLAEADNAWTRALTLTQNPDPNIARQMVQAYGPAGLNEPTKAVSAFEVVLPTVTPPTAQIFATYATLAYEAGQTRKAELASRKAIKLSSRDELAQIKAQLSQARSEAKASSSSTSSTPSAGATPSTTG